MAYIATLCLNLINAIYECYSSTLANVAQLTLHNITYFAMKL
ncbi:hypothetical protein PSM_A0605 [Pseudoalteromonas sp. SM9913]|nr:hypothetical protein PSM_A0605 [Pseudoalteromonas sp. SM9913]